MIEYFNFKSLELLFQNILKVNYLSISNRYIIITISMFYILLVMFVISCNLMTE
jgi:hypothetical protein